MTVAAIAAREAIKDVPEKQRGLAIAIVAREYGRTAEDLGRELGRASARARASAKAAAGAWWNE